MDTTGNSGTRQRYGQAPGRKGWLTFLRPGWVIMFLLIIAFSYAAFTFLAPWQLGKDDAIVHRNEQIDAAFRTDPVPASEVFGPDGSITPEDEWRRVTLQGEYLTDAEVLLRMRPVDSSPAFHALTPFRLESGETILVNRGFTVPLDGNVPDITDAPTGPLTIAGHARLNEVEPTSTPPGRSTRCISRSACSASSYACSAPALLTPAKLPSVNGSLWASARTSTTLA